jgi:hypothetical protein
LCATTKPSFANDGKEEKIEAETPTNTIPKVTHKKLWFETENFNSYLPPHENLHLLLKEIELIES